ncbi:DUF3667 domain-containing protein [Myroides indicus]|uniref:Uncharacterized protein DUF3667 n=1 Tax=Myroides indicus TaxID=1323422 RepID=A0A4V3E9P4_9FLAO|nr:DUF3667 domain-containing protein [Myroides indicus]TDS66132.1 uncharacterized protein DUF3667 [Myroides indicus]
MEICKSCNESFQGNFCSNCGYSVYIKRIDHTYIRNEILSIFNFDKGIFLTIKELFIRPGESIKEFLTTDRNRLVKPVLFILITSIIYSLINNYFKIEIQYGNHQEMNNPMVLIFGWIQNNYGYANILMAVFISFILRLFFRKSGYNIYEILILLCFVMGMGMLIFSFFAILEGLTQSSLMNFASIVGAIYTTWAIGHFFGKKKFINYIKALTSYILGMILFSFSAIFLAILISLITKQ